MPVQAVYLRNEGKGRQSFLFNSRVAEDLSMVILMRVQDPSLAVYPYS